MAFVLPDEKPRKAGMRAILGVVFFAVSGTFLLFPSRYLSSKTVGASDANWNNMIEEIESGVAEYNGQVGIYFKDLASGRVYERNADEKFVSASLIKVPVMAATLQAVHDGSIDLDTLLKLQSKHRRGGSGHLRSVRTGTRLPLSQIIYRMITDSDNTATAMLIDRLGYRYLNQSFAAFGLKTMRIDPVGMSLSDRIHPARENYTTPREMAYLLEMIYRHRLVSDGFSDFMLEVLKGAKSPTRLARFLPDDMELARKTGLLRMNCHDAGIIFAKNGDFILCVMTGKNTTYRDAKGVIASVGKSIYSYVGHS